MHEHGYYPMDWLVWSDGCACQLKSSRAFIGHGKGEVDGGKGSFEVKGQEGAVETKCWITRQFVKYHQVFEEGG